MYNRRVQLFLTLSDLLWVTRARNNPRPKVCVSQSCLPRLALYWDSGRNNFNGWIKEISSQLIGKTFLAYLDPNEHGIETFFKVSRNSVYDGINLFQIAPILLSKNDRESVPIFGEGLLVITPRWYHSPSKATPSCLPEYDQ